MSGGTGYGVTPQGFVKPQLTDVQTDINQALQAGLGSDINLSPESFFGQISGVISERLELVWQAMQDVYGSQTPDTAFGASLDNVGALRGIPRLPASFSIVQNVKLFGTAGTPVPAGTQFSVQNAPTSVFSLNATTVLGAGQSCIQTIGFSTTPASGTWTLANLEASTGALAWNITAAALQTAIQSLPFCSGCTVTGTYSTQFTITFNGAGTGGFMVQPEFTATSSLLNGSSAAVTVIPAITQAGIDQASVTMTATATGPIIANAGTLINIVTPVSGLTNVLNIIDAVAGTNIETDNAYRLRMSQELQISGAGTVEAIRSRLLAVSGVTSVLVYENVTDITNGQGLPPHSFEAVVNGGSAANIAEAIWLAKPAGIQTYGNESYTITDSQGLQHVIHYSIPTVIDIYITVNLLVNTSFPANGATTIKGILANYINALGQGVSVIVDPYLIAQLASVPGIDGGVAGVPIFVGTAPGPTLPNNIPIEAFEVAFTQTDFIIVNTSPG